MARFNSIERLQAWEASGAFPAIHNDIFGMVQAYARGDRMLDICCSYGLLGQRLLTAGAEAVCGIEMDTTVVEAAREAGIAVPILNIKITRDTLPEVLAFLAEHKPTVLVARRCISEIFATDLEWGPAFSRTIRTAGIAEVVLEGRAIVARPTHPIPTVVEEVACLAGAFREVRRVGQCSHMVALD